MQPNQNIENRIHLKLYTEMDKSVGSHSFMNLHSYQFPCSRRRRDFWNGNFSHLFPDCDIISSSEIWSTRESVMRSPSLLVSTENPFNIVCVQTLIAAAAQQTSALWILLFHRTLYRVWIRFVFIAWCYARCVEPSKLCPRWPPSAETSQLSNVPSFTPGEGRFACFVCCRQRCHPTFCLSGSLSCSLPSVLSRYKQ